MALLKCLEPVTAIACGLGAFALDKIDGGLTAGAMIGGAALLRAFGEARSTHGLESDAHIERTRLAILRAVALEDHDEAARDSIGLADSALAEHLAEAMPSREELGAAAVDRQRYPAAACALILERLEGRDARFRDDPVARTFAERVITVALQEGLNNPDYIQLLSVHILTAVAQRVAELNAKVDRLLALTERSNLTDQALRGAIARFIAFQPEASDADVLNAVAIFERDYRALLEQVSHIQVHDNHIQSLKNATEEALVAGDIATARTRYADAATAAADKASELVHNAATLRAAEASTALAMLDWQAADAAWDAAAAMLTPFDLDAGEAIVAEAAERLRIFGETFAQTPALAASERRWRAQADTAGKRGDIKRVAAMQNNLGIVLWVQGERTGGEVGLALLGDAVAAYRAALTVRTQAEMPADWAMTQNNLGNVLSVQGERTGGEAGLALLGEAVAAYRAALTVRTQAEMPAEWAMTQNNLGAVLQVQGARTGGEVGLALLGDAVAAYRAALTVYTQAEMPTEWAGTQNNLGIVLRVQGAQTGGEAGLALLGEAVAAYRAALTVRTQAEMPADWAMTKYNLGLALVAQAGMAAGDAGVSLLREAISAYQAALTVFTPEHMPYDYEKAQRHLAEAEAALAARLEGGG